MDRRVLDMALDSYTDRDPVRITIGWTCGAGDIPGPASRGVRTVETGLVAGLDLARRRGAGGNPERIPPCFAVRI